MCVLKLVEGKKETDLAREIGANAARLPLAGYEQMKREKKEIKKGVRGCGCKTGHSQTRRTETD